MMTQITRFTPPQKARLSYISATLSTLLIFSSDLRAFQIEDVSFDTSLGVQTRLFDNSATSPEQRRHEEVTLDFEQEISYQWNEGKNSWVFTPYLSLSRYQDPISPSSSGNILSTIPIPIIDFGGTRTAHRLYADVRDFLFTNVADSNTWEVRYGIGRVFWGTTESAHLVDVINQDDLQADIDGEDKLGQSMINLKLFNRYGNFDLFVLPGFREQRYHENVGRLNPVFVRDPYSPISETNRVFMINQNETTFESGAEELHTDLAFRWSNSIGVSDIGLSFFQGTNRDPVIGQFINEELATPAFAAAGQAATENERLASLAAAMPESNISSQFLTLSFITPHYEQMTQFGIDYQATLGGWLLKLEAVHRDSPSLKTPSKDLEDGKTSGFTTDYQALTTGFEYTFNSIFGSAIDVGLLAEYQWDSREFEATTTGQNDVFLGIRYARNTPSDPALLIGVSQDLDFDSYLVYVEGSKRIWSSSKISIDLLSTYADGNAPQITQGIGQDATVSLANEDHVRLKYQLFF